MEIIIGRATISLRGKNGKAVEAARDRAQEALAASPVHMPVECVFDQYAFTISAPIPPRFRPHLVLSKACAAVLEALPNWTGVPGTRGCTLESPDADAGVEIYPWEIGLGAATERQMGQLSRTMMEALGTALP
ncbi:MAG: hypothetical protein ACR2RB_10830 [Gammaproteobacteria bacterium]